LSLRDRDTRISRLGLLETRLLLGGIGTLIGTVIALASTRLLSRIL